MEVYSLFSVLKKEPIGFVAFSTLTHVILHAGLAPDLQNLLFKSRGKPSPSAEDAHQTDEGL